MTDWKTCSAALKIIFSYNIDYDSVLERESIPRLSERREKMFTHFAVKNSENHRVNDLWFPKKEPTNHNTRTPLVYVEERAKTGRLLNSPIYQMRKRLNEFLKR